MAENTNELSHLTDARLLDELETLASKLEDGWKKGPVDLAALLPAPPSPLRKHALLELIKVDLECRWRHSQPVVLDYYLDRFPDLGKPRDLPAKLVFEEYRVRHLWGDKPPLTLYQTRFPAQFEQLQRYLSDEPLPTVNQGITAVKPTEDKKRLISKTAPVEPTAPESHVAAKHNTAQMGEYRMIERLGSGAFGEVWKVELPGGIMKAVKIIFRPLDHEEAKRELESLELIKGLRHHFLLQTISFKPSEDRLRILMDLADCSLRDLLKKAKKEGKTGLPLEDNVKWLRQAAEALDYLHAKKMQHRDIKPENILLSEGNVRVADFGLARVQQTARLASMSGAGTPLYMPPESWNDKQHANSDQYSLAATYAECRLGKRIYQSDGLASLMHAHVHDTPKLDPLPPAEQKVLLKALSKNPDHRYSTCMAFADELTGAVVKQLRPGSVPGLGAISIEVPVGGRHGRQKQKQTQLAFLVAGIFAVMVCAALLVILLTPRKDTIFVPVGVAAGTFQPVKDTELVTVGGKPFYKQIECRIGADPELVVRFNFIPWQQIGKQSFYLMENKVSNEVYRAFAKSGRLPLSGARWELGARIAPQLTEEQLEKRQGSLPYAIYPFFSLFSGPSHFWNGPALWALDDNDGDNVFAVLVQENWPVPDDRGAANHPKWPVLRVDIQDAHLCAQWLGGFLPTAEQWDKAAGAFEDDRGQGPFVSPFAADEIAVDRAHRGPLPVGSAVKDVVPFSGCRDMSGNGLEWTRSIIFDNDTKEYMGDSSSINVLGKVQLRGQRFSAPEPLTYAVLKDRALELPFHQRRRPPGEDIEIGFRIAVLLP